MRVIQTIHRSSRMFHVILGTVAILAATALPVSSRAQTQPADELSEIMKLTGLDVFYRHGSGPISSLFKERFRKHPADSNYRKMVFAAVDVAAREVFSPAKLRGELHAALKAKLDKADYAAILAFYRSPLGDRMMFLQKGVFHTVGYNERDAAKVGLMKRLAKQKERVQALRIVNKFSIVFGVGPKSAYYLVRVIDIGQLAASRQTASLTSEVIAKVVAKLGERRPEILGYAERDMWLDLMYAYRDARVEDLRQYAGFLSSPVGKKFYRAGEEAIREIYIRAGTDFGHALMKALGKEHS